MDLFESIDASVLTLLSALTYAAAQAIYREALRKLNIAMATMIVNSTLGVCSITLYFASGGGSSWHAMGLLWFGMIGVLGPFFGRYMTYFSMTLIGLARTHIMAQTAPIWSSLLAVILLGETIGWAVGIGTMFVLSGALLLIQEREFVRTKIPLWHYMVPIAGALALAVTHVIRKIGYEYIDSPALAICISMTVGLTLQLGAYRFTERKSAGRWDPGSAFLAFMGGLLNFAAAICFWTAIKVGDVVSVVPISRLSVLFVLFFSWLFFKKQENITWRTVAGALLALSGAAAIAVWK